MIKRFAYVGLLVTALALGACSKGLDRKLDLSGSAKELGASYGLAMKDATPEQQNIMRERFAEVMKYIEWLATNSNPALTEAVAAKRNAEELDAVSKMTVREFLIHYLTIHKRSLEKTIPAVAQFVEGKALQLEHVTIDQVSPAQTTESTSSIELQGKLSLKNTSTEFDFNFRGCKLALVLIGQQQEKLSEGSDCRNYEVIAPGETRAIAYTHRLSDRDMIPTIGNALKQNQGEKIGWVFLPTDDSYITGKGNVSHKISASELAQYKEDLEKIKAAIATFQK